MKRGLQVWFVLVIAVLLAGTIYASLEKNVLQAYVDLGRDRWGLATLFDAYFAFTAVWLWIAYKEAVLWKQALWLLLLYALGNFAISAYLLWQLAKWDPKTGAAGILLRVPAKAPAARKKRR